MKNFLPILFFLLTAGAVSAAQPRTSRDTLSLAGRWQSTLGPCRLPGTTDENRLGPGCADTAATHQLTRLYPFAGTVVYSRDIDLPAAFAGRTLRLVMERTKPAALRIDGDSIGFFGHLGTPHRHLLPRLAAGPHRIEIAVDNSPGAVPPEIHSSHAWSEATQTDWNGILGEFFIEALPEARIETLQLYPDVEQRRVHIVARIVAERPGRALLTLGARSWNSPETRTVAPRSFPLRLKKGLNRFEPDLDMGPDPLLWSEFHPALYRLTATLRTHRSEDRRTLDFGMRSFRAEGTQFAVNGCKTFLRGKHDACVFPLTGYAPTDVKEWRRLFRIARAYGINHYRFHSWAPPRAAFAAADIEGIYLQPELPLWGTVDPANRRLNDFLVREGMLLLDEMGDHPSFVLMGLGNELSGDTLLMRSWVEAFRRHDPRPLYCFGANDFLGWHGSFEGEDFTVACRVGGGEGCTSHVRTSFAFVDAPEGGLLNASRPSSTADFSRAIAGVPRPVVGHETGQFQSFPDFTQIERYTGVLRPFNLEIFRRRLADNALDDQAADFARASGRFAVRCYKAEIEQALRTPGLGGFQLLDLQDYPGQGTALVGILDAFMQSKGLVAPETFRESCSPVVPLALVDDFCRWSDEPLRFGIALANYSESEWSTPLSWELSAEEAAWSRSGTLPAHAAQGSVADLGTVALALDSLAAPCRLTLTLSTGPHRNRYPLWVYPRHSAAPDGIVIASELDDTLRRQLDAGARVLLVPRHDAVLRQSVGGMFTPDFWNYSMFRTISENAGRPVSPGTLSLLCDPAHPLFRAFPTDGHSDWQWWSIARASRPLILDALRGYKPLVQVIDNIERCHRLGLLFEFAVGRGRLLVCMCDLDAVATTPEGNQWRNALFEYAASPHFDPAVALSWEELRQLFDTEAATRRIEGAENASDYTQH